MKLLSLALPVAAALPSFVSAQSVSVTLGAGSPVIRGSLGPLTVSTTLGRGRADVRTGARTAARASSVLATADRYVGTRYVYGGATPKGFDCSGFVQYVFARHDVKLPRTSRQQATAGKRLSSGVAALEPGDLMFFASNGSRIDHVAIYAGKNRIIHSSAGGKGVRYDDLSSSRGKWFLEHHVSSRRVITDGRGLVRDLESALAAQ
ncbi:MAG TPA: C40 family peptidase [Gemmatimonadaceae bacterium]|nr:C40 family peptidase [Gemmatimonadaceae bacterium]